MCSMSNESMPVLLNIEGLVATLTLNNPPRNTMNAEMLDCFVEQLQRVQSEPSVRALVVCSEGRHFCAGAELHGGLPGRSQALGGPVGTADQLRDVYRPFLELLQVPIPTVAVVQGGAVGGGLGLALACDFRVVSPDTRFLAPFAKLGIHPGMGLIHLLLVLIGPSRAMEMLLMGQEVRGQQAVEWGLANRCVDPVTLRAEAHEMARTLAAQAPAVVRWSKRAIHRAIAMDPNTAADVEALAQALTFQSQDAQEGMKAFFEKRAPDFTGS